MKKIVVIVLSVFLLTGCFSNKTNQDDGTKRIYLTSSYYKVIPMYYLLTIIFVI